MVESIQNSCYILGQRVDYTTYNKASNQILAKARDKQNGYVCVSNVHMIMEGNDDPKFRQIVNEADLITPDGMPLVLALKLLGIRKAERIYGPTLMLRICQFAGREGISVGFYGGTENVLRMLRKNLLYQFNDLKIAYTYNPPFKPLSKAEDNKIVQDIINSGAQILFVGLGCPKQEKWMADHKKYLSIPTIGVGAAFDFIAGVKTQAPKIMQRVGLEWFFRLMSEPRRLWWRYLYHNPRFLFKFALQLLRIKKYQPKY